MGWRAGYTRTDSVGLRKRCRFSVWGKWMNPARIMVVEDDLTLAHVIRSRLEKLGYEVSSLVSSGEDAVRVALEDHPDLILMDVMLEDVTKDIKRVSFDQDDSTRRSGGDADP